MTKTLLSVENLKVYFPSKVEGSLRSRYIPLKAVDDVSFEVKEGETVGIVGESGCGKSTLSRAIMQLLKPTEGRVVWQGEDLTTLNRKAMSERRRDLNMVFQDPLSSLNPRMTIGNIIAEPLRRFHPELSKEQIEQRVRDTMRDVNLSPDYINRYPHEFSGGQCQRVSIARAMILRPKLMICDEPVSALDVSTQAQIINLLKELQQKYGLSIIFISHDLSVVRMVCKRILVMYLGHVIETADRDTLFNHPAHPYSKALLSAIPTPDLEAQQKNKRIILKGELPSPTHPPTGCVFRTRCPIATSYCVKRRPILKPLATGAMVACHHVNEDGSTDQTQVS